MWQDKVVSLAIVDDHPIIIEGLRTLLKDEQQINIKATFTTGFEFENYLKKNTVDVVLLDISLPDINGIDLCKTIKSNYPNTFVIALSNHAERSIIMEMIESGASGYLLKNVSSADLIRCIFNVLNKELTFSKEISSIIINPFENQTSKIPRITRREKEVLQFITEGKTTQEIANLLFVSHLTIETHRRNLMVKLDVKNAPELVMEAIKHKLLA